MVSYSVAYLLSHVHVFQTGIAEEKISIYTSRPRSNVVPTPSLNETSLSYATQALGSLLSNLSNFTHLFMNLFHYPKLFKGKGSIYLCYHIKSLITVE